MGLPFSRALFAASSVYTLPLASVNEPDPGVTYITPDDPLPPLPPLLPPEVTSVELPSDTDPSWF